jgi:hypothetical protein
MMSDFKRLSKMFYQFGSDKSREVYTAVDRANRLF